MASRSFKPASYLARPPFTRSSSSSSVRSTKSEDSIVSTLKSLSVEHKEEKKVKGKENINTYSPGHNTSSSRSHYFEEPTTPSRKRSAPIAIQAPGRDPRAVYTPLSARGDLPGGYFPNHEEIQRSYKSHPFHNPPEANPPSLFVPSAMAEFESPGLDATPRGHHGLTSPGFPPEVMQLPKGKYHPSNYSNPNSSASTPTGHTVPPSFPPYNLSLSLNPGNRSGNSRSLHERRGSDVKRKIKQYQRDMIAQSLLGAGGSVKVPHKKPASPKLEPCGSPGPITPFELEESDGYMVAGGRAPRSIDIDRQRKRDLEDVERMIATEEKRALSPRTRI